MKTPLLALALALATATALHAEGPLDRLGEILTYSSAHGEVRARLSGTIDLEGYILQQPAPGLLFSTRDSLFNPRLSLFLDAQFGPSVYAFAQVRADNGFDPGYGGQSLRFEEYALRFSPWKSGILSLQVGKFSTVVGNRGERHGSWESGFITAPSAYENLTAIWDGAGSQSPTQFLGWGHVTPGQTTASENSDKHFRLPLIWGPSYATGISISGKLGHFEYAAELKNTGLSSRPGSWDLDAVNLDHPAFAARIAYRPDPAWAFGLSAASGPYLTPAAAPTLPKGRDIGDYRQLMLAQDISYAHGHFQLWAEFFETRYEVPTVGHADTFAYYLEAKYKFTPQLFTALRWNQQLYADIRDGNGDSTPWGQDLWRVDAVLGVRPTAHTQLKLQYSLEHRDRSARENGHLLAGQFTVHF